MNEKMTGLRGYKRRKKEEDNSTPHVLQLRTKGTRVLFAIVFILFVLYSIALIYPFILLFVNALKDGLEYLNDLNRRNIMDFPDVALWNNFTAALKNMSAIDSSGRDIYMLEMFRNSLMYALGRSCAASIASVLTSYVIARYDFKGRSLLYGISVFTLTIPIVGNTGSMLKMLTETGLYNTPLYIFIASFGGFGFNFIVLNGFFRNISWSYAEAAMIDGAGHFSVFSKVMLPQAIPTVITLIVVDFIAAWNDYTSVLLYLPDFPTLASGLYKIELSITRGGNYPIYFAGILLSLVPVLVLFTCCSNVIMKNLSVGGLKG